MERIITFNAPKYERQPEYRLMDHHQDQESPRGEVHIDSAGRSEGNKLLSPAVSNWEHTRDVEMPLALRILPIISIRGFLSESTGDLLNAHNINREYLRMNDCIERFLSSFDTDI